MASQPLEGGNDALPSQPAAAAAAAELSPMAMDVDSGPAPSASSPPTDAPATGQALFPLSSTPRSMPSDFVNPFSPATRRSNISSEQMDETQRIHMLPYMEPGPDSDTLVFVDFPRKQDGTKYMDCKGAAFHDLSFRVSSAKLLATGSAKFKDLLGPSKQFRTVRRRKLGSGLPPGVKYVVDLTPPSEGEEAVYNMTELSLPPRVIEWKEIVLAKSRTFLVGHVLVDGHDDACECFEDSKRENDQTLIDFQSSWEAQLSQRNASGSLGESDAKVKEDNSDDHGMTDGDAAAPSATAPGPSDESGCDDCKEAEKIAGKGKATADAPAARTRKIQEYCVLRHTLGVVRLLMKIEGHDIVLNSAPRVWTMVGVAKILDCAKVMEDSVLQWIMSLNNTVFVEKCPEEAIMIGFALENAALASTAFCILVSEYALSLAAPDGGRMQKKRITETVYGRQTYHLDDEIRNLIEHAARSLIDNIHDRFDVLSNPRSYDKCEIEMWDRLQRARAFFSGPDKPAESEKALAVINELETSVMDGISEVVNHTVRSSSVGSYCQFFGGDNLKTAWSTFNHTQKLLTPFPYDQLWCRLSDPAALWRTLSSAAAKSKDAILRLQREYAELSRSIGGGGAPSDHVPLFDARVFLSEAYTLIAELAQSTISLQEAPREIPLQYSKHLLLALRPAELKFLPLWAGGNNDGSGGVFEVPVPEADLGPVGPGPAFHTGFSVPSDATGSSCGSVVDGFTALRVESVVSVSSTLGPGSVTAQDSRGRSDASSDDGGSVGRSETFTAAEDDEMDFCDARATDQAAVSMTAEGGRQADVLGDLSEPAASSTAFYDFEIDYNDDNDGSDFDCMDDSDAETEKGDGKDDE